MAWEQKERVDTAVADGAEGEQSAVGNVVGPDGGGAVYAQGPPGRPVVIA